MMQKVIAIFASGSGTNAENIYNYFLGTNISIKYIVCNNPNAGVLRRFENTDVEVILIQKKALESPDLLAKLYGVDLIVLAGFLVLIPASFVQAFPKKIINIHPALLPKYGGKGMYGDHIHKAVLENNEKEHGITIHYVNEEFDKGEIIFQEEFVVTENDNLASIQEKIHTLEFQNYPKVIERLLTFDLLLSTKLC
ncbi:MAG: phosphoribosylglycinamide formyltransferase [Chitinophagales bacterium]|nr:phosphoribosylglycinamide formyltransferase [Chitinophagales bacterium]